MRQLWSCRLNFIPSSHKKHVEVLTAGAYEFDFIQKKSLYRYNQGRMRSYLCKVGFWSNITNVLIGREETHRENAMWYDDEGRDSRCKLYKSRNFNYFQKPPEEKRKVLDRFSFSVLRKNMGLPTSWCRTSMSKTMGWSTPIYANLLWQSWEINTPVFNHPHLLLYCDWAASGWLRMSLLNTYKLCSPRGSSLSVQPSVRKWLHTLHA